MKIKNRQLLIVLISILIALSALMILTYIQGTAIFKEVYPFSMGRNYVVMKGNPEQPVSFEDIIDINEDTGILVISRNENAETVGVYDPNMVMAFENTQWIIGYTRYFSYDDYLNKTKSGIIISDIPDREFKYYTSEKISEAIYCTGSNSRFNYDGHTKEVVNLASLDALGDYVYLDYGDELVANRIIGRLADSGYNRLSIEYVGLLKSLFSSKESYDGLMTAGLLIYAFFGLVAFWHFYNDRKRVFIHFLHGGSLKKMASKLVGQFVILSLVGLIPVLIFSFFQRRTGYFMMTNFSLLMFLITHVLLTSLMFTLAFTFVFSISSYRKRGDNYVR